MAFITNQTKDGQTTLGKRLTEQSEEIEGILHDIRAIRGSDYLSLIKRHLDAEAIVVTIENR